MKTSLRVPVAVGRGFAATMERLGISPGNGVAVALSGGPDSTALAILTFRWSSAAAERLGQRATSRPPWGFIVDHRLRPESSEEAADVALAAQRIGLRPVVLTWDRWDAAGVPAHGRRMAAARDARYSLLAEACKDRGVHSLLVAHHAGDQAETFLMRLSRASGLKGLAGMAEVSMYSGQGAAGRVSPQAAEHSLQIVRPLLHASKQELEGYCRHHGHQWVSDPSNQDETYQRVAIRSLLCRVAQEEAGSQGSPPGGASSLSTDILRVVGACASLKAALHQQAEALIDRATVEQRRVGWPGTEGGERPDAGTLVVTVRGAVLVEPMVPREAALEALEALLQRVSGSPYPPRSGGVQRLRGLLLAGRGFLRGAFDVGGCSVRPVAGSRGALFSISPLAPRTPAAAAVQIPVYT